MSKEKIIKDFRQLEFEDVNSELMFMKGKILTIIDALGLKEPQNKATKDLIHSAIGITKNTFWRYTIGEDVFSVKNSKENN